MPISVKTPVYEGPLDLLLELIEKRKLLINDISLSAVTDEYIARVSGKDLPVGETAEFISLAATLLLIKSRSLLPSLTLSEDESRDIKELEYRLAVYQLLKESARTLSRAVEESSYLYEGDTPQLEPLFLPDASTTQESLLSAAQALIAGFPQHLLLPQVQVKQIISLEEMITRLGERVSKAMSLSFKEFSGFGKNEKREVIVSFLALLELVKQGIIKATQSHSGDILLEQDAVSTPSL